MREGTVLRVLVGPPGVTYSKERDEIKCLWGGIVEDRHYGRKKAAGVREKYVARGDEILNLRQVSIVSIEELKEIADLMNIPKVTGADLGANLVLEGIDYLSDISPGTVLKFSGGAAFFVTGENLPCRHPGENIQSRYQEIDGLAKMFPKAALGRRGLVAIVLKPGKIKIGDSVEIVD